MPIEPNLLETGIYTVPEIAQLVRAPQRLVRVWVEGRKGRQFAVIDNQLGRVDGKVAVSFTNLMELRFVALFHTAGVRLREIRAIMGEAQQTLMHPHPFATEIVFRTDGKKIVAEIARKHGANTVYDLRTKNYEMFEVVVDSWRQDVRYDASGEMIAWYPRREIAPHVLLHPHFAFGRPVIEADHIPAETLANAVHAEGSPRVVARLFEVPERQVREAVKFQQDLLMAA